MRFLCCRNWLGTPRRQNSPCGWTAGIDCPGSSSIDANRPWLGLACHQMPRALDRLSRWRNTQESKPGHSRSPCPEGLHYALYDEPPVHYKAGHTEAALAPPQSELGPVKRVICHMNELHGRHQHQCDRPRRAHGCHTMPVSRSAIQMEEHRQRITRPWPITLPREPELRAVRRTAYAL